jgi:hypothetical protein
LIETRGFSLIRLEISGSNSSLNSFSGASFTAESEESSVNFRKVRKFFFIECILVCGNAIRRDGIILDFKKQNERRNSQPIAGFIKKLNQFIVQL